MRKHRVVILGGGFGGLSTALQLERRSRRMKSCEILLVDRHSEHLYTPLLYEVATGFLDEPTKECRGELRQGICISFEQFRTIIGARHIRYKRAEITGLDTKKRQVLVEEGEPIPYDDLVIALGSETNFFDVPGLEAHAHPMKTLHDAYRLRGKLHAYLERYREGKEQFIAVVVSGAGPTGTEFAAEVANFFQRLVKKGVIRRDSFSVTLVDAAPDVLMPFPPALRAAARRRLSSLGVRVVMGRKVKEVKKGSVVIATEQDVEEWESDLVVWCGGIKPSRVLEHFPLPKGPKGHLDVEATLHVKGEENIYALGDGAQFLDEKGVPVPALAQTAIAESRLVAENLVRHFEKRPLKRWQPPDHWLQVAPMGGGFALARVGGAVNVHGRIGYYVRKAADMRYFLRILPWRFAMELWMHGAKTYIKND